MHVHSGPETDSDPDFDRSTRRLRLLAQGLTVDVAPGQTLLDAALAAGLRLRSSCRNGTCRACMARLQEGAVRYRIQWPGLSVEERQEGWVLTCVALPETDVTLLQPLIDPP